MERLSASTSLATVEKIRAVVVGERGILQPAFDPPRESLEGRLRGLVDLSLAAGPQMDDRRAYALVRAESTPLASEPMLLPSAM